MRRAVLPATLCCVVFFAQSAYALDMEYYTYNGFDAVVPAFQKVGLIFGDSNYQSLLFCVLTAAFAFGSLAVVMKALGGRFSTAAWAAPIAMGFIIYAAMIVPKGTLHVYDPVKNEDQAVGGIPDGVVMLAGLLNRVERAFVDMIYTSVTPDSYQVQAGGIGYDMLYNLGSVGVTLGDKNVQASLQKYVEDCLFFELQRPGTTLTVDAFAKNTDFSALFAQAASPAIYTTYYDNTGDNTMTCQVAWNNLIGVLGAGAVFDESLKTQCAEAGFDPTVPAELTQCEDTLASTVNWLQGASFAALDIHRQMLYGQTLNNALLQASPDVAMTVLASRNTGSSLIGAGLLANQWIPALRAVVTAVTIGLIPFLVIFLPTPLMSKAATTICGFFIWLTAWGVTDAVVHTFGMDFGKKALYEVTVNQLGLGALMSFSTGGMKALAIFGALRWSGVMLATVLTGMLIRMGGSVLGQLSRQVIATPMGQGQQAGMTVGTPEGMSKELNALEGAMPTIANAHKFRYDDRTNVLTAKKWGATEAGMEIMSSFDGVVGSAEMYGRSEVGRQVSFSARGQAMENIGLGSSYNTLTGGAEAGIDKTQKELALFGGNPERFADAQVSQVRGAIVGAGGFENYIRNLEMAGQADQAGKVRGALLRSRLTGEDFETAYKNNIEDGLVYSAAMNTKAGELLRDPQVGLGGLVESGVIGEKGQIAQSRAIKDLADRLHVPYEWVQNRLAAIQARQEFFGKTAVDDLALQVGRGDRDAGFRMLAEYSLANTRADLRTYGSVSTMIGALTLQKNLTYGDALGKAQAAAEIDMNPREFAELTSNLSAQDAIGIAKAINAGHLSKDNLRDAAFMNKAHQFLNEYQLYDSARSGGVAIPRSLYNEDGTMDERMKQLWIQKNTDMVGKRIQCRDRVRIVGRSRIARQVAFWLVSAAATG